MMRLRKATGPEDLTIEKLHVTLTVRPYGAAVMEDARNDPALVEERRAELDALGVELTGDSETDLKLWPMHTQARIFNRAIARAAIIGWDGVLDDKTGKPAPVTPEAINAAMDHDLFHREFRDLYITPGFMLDAEKNG